MILVTKPLPRLHFAYVLHIIKMGAGCLILITKNSSPIA